MKNVNKAATVLLISGLFVSANAVAGGAKSGSDPEQTSSQTTTPPTTTINTSTDGFLKKVLSSLSM